MKKKKYIVRIICPDCSYGQDLMGCFDGGTEEEEFESLKEAIEYGEKCTKDSIWEVEYCDEYGIELSKKIINPAYKKIYGYNYV